MKPVYQSKINILQVITIGVGMASMWGFIPEENKVKILESLVLLSPVATIVLRTWFTSLPISWGDDQ